MQISLIMPAFNEENRIGKNLELVKEYMAKKFDDYEIIIVNDGSSDKTVQVAVEYADEHLRVVSYEKNHGKGYAVKTGIMNAMGDFCVFTDVDIPYGLDAIYESYQMYLNNDNKLIFGKRNQETNSALRKIMSFGFNTIVNAFLGMGIEDTQCGFKAFETKTAQDIFSNLTIWGYGFDVELYYLAVKKGYKIDRIPVTLINTEGSKINVVSDSIKMLGELKKIKDNNKRGVYN